MSVRTKITAIVGKAQQGVRAAVSGGTSAQLARRSVFVVWVWEGPETVATARDVCERYGTGLGWVLRGSYTDPITKTIPWGSISALAELQANCANTFVTTDESMRRMNPQQRADLLADVEFLRGKITVLKRP